MAQDIIKLQPGNIAAVILTIESTSIKAIEKALLNKVQKSPLFFQNLNVALNYSESLEQIEMDKLLPLLAEYGISLIGVTGWSNKLQKELIITAGLAALGNSQELNEEITDNSYFPAMVIEDDIVSGQAIYAKNRDLIVFGNVHAGADIAADGNIHVYGKLQGRATSGLNMKQQNSAIYCQYLDADFISVSKHFVYHDNIPIDALHHAVRAVVTQDGLTFEPLMSN